MENTLHIFISDYGCNSRRELTYERDVFRYTMSEYASEATKKCGRILDESCDVVPSDYDHQ